VVPVYAGENNHLVESHSCDDNNEMRLQSRRERFGEHVGRSEIERKLNSPKQNASRHKGSCCEGEYESKAFGVICKGRGLELERDKFQLHAGYSARAS